MQALQAGARFEVEVEALAAGGQGLARISVGDGRLVVFIDHALPGQRVSIEITRLKAGSAEARRLEVLRPSVDEAEVQCPHFGECGGCAWQDLDYAAQLLWKQRLAVDNFRKLPGIAGEAEALVAQCVPSPLIYDHRNKMEFAFAGRGRDLRLGLHRRGSAEVLDVPGCRLMPEPAGKLRRMVQEACVHSGLGSYEALEVPGGRGRRQTRKSGPGRGTWRFLVIRRNLAGEYSLEFITGPDEHAHAVIAGLAEKILEAELAVRSVIHSIREDSSAVAYGERTVQTLGPASMGRLAEQIEGELFYLSPGAFFQTNTLAAANLAAVVDELAGTHDLATVFDIYGGSGLLSRRLVPRAEQVVVFESSDRAVDDGRDAAAASSTDKVEFRQGSASWSLGQAAETPDLAIVDPPRAGLDPGVRKRLLRMPPSRLIYVSCHPASQARDLRELLAVYDLVEVRPVDLFPHSPHVETVALLSRKK